MENTVKEFSAEEREDLISKASSVLEEAQESIKHSRDFMEKEVPVEMKEILKRYDDPKAFDRVLGRGSSSIASLMMQTFESDAVFSTSVNEDIKKPKKVKVRRQKFHI